MIILLNCFCFRYHPVQPEGMQMSAPPTQTGIPPPNTANMPPTRVDTSQPPPQAIIPPMTNMNLPLVPPFQMMRGAALPLQLPPGMLGTNVPIGVPPPNLQQSLLQNQMMGYGHQQVLPSPHMGQMPPMGMNSSLPPPNGPPPDKNPLIGAGPPPAFGDQRIPPVLSQPPPNMKGFIPGAQQQPPPSSQPHHDDMDIDMDDMEQPPPHHRGEKSNISLSEQLLAAIEGNYKI